MLKNYLKIAFRNIFKHKAYSLINILGLSIGMAACWFIFEYVRFEVSYDRWHKNADRIYRVPLSLSNYFTETDAGADNYAGVGPAMQAEFPEVEGFARLAPSSVFVGTTMLSYTDEKGRTKRFNESNIYLAAASFLAMFSFPFQQGDPATALANPNTAVIAETLAGKYFDGGNPMGKTVTLRGLSLTITGVFRDIPENSHIHFNMLVSLGPKFWYTNWESPSFYNYVRLVPGTSPKKLEAKFPAFIEKYLGKKMREFNLPMQFHLQPLTEIHLKPSAGGEPEQQGSEKTLYFLSVLGIFILVIAWINYINLSTAKSLERAREVGVRKVAGASRLQLAGQFLLESMLVNSAAVVLTILIVVATGPFFDRLTGKGISRAFFASGLWRQGSFWLILLGIFLAGALQVGAYPAFVLSGFKPVQVLKGRFQRSAKGVFLRQALVTFQFVLSILLIAGSFIVYRQLQYMRSQDPGYSKDRLLIVKAPAIIDSTFRSRLNAFKAELLKNPAIRGVAPTSEIPGQVMDANNAVRRADQNKNENGYADFLAIDKDFIPTYGVKLLAGENFQDQEPGDWIRTKKTTVMINETLARQLGYRSPAAAIHQQIDFHSWVGDIRAEILGVVKNYQQQSLEVAYHPMMFYQAHILPSYFSINIGAKSLPAGLAYIQSLYGRIFPGNAYESFFLNEHFNRQYQADQKLGRFFGLFTILAIFVACMGLLGLSSFVIRLRMSEIAIRKILGAPVYRLLALLSKDFIRLVVFASVLALPIVYFVASRWLGNYAFHIRVGAMILILPPVLLLMIAMLTIGWQSLTTAMANPIKELRND